MPIGELHATYVFPTVQSAKTGWEKVSQRCRNLSVNRWAIDGTPATAVAVTVLTEEEDRREFEKARALLGRKGSSIDAPLYVLETMRNKRARMYAATGGKRVVIRTPEGTAVTRDGINLGPVRRPQG